MMLLSKVFFNVNLQFSDEAFNTAHSSLTTVKTTQVGQTKMEATELCSPTAMASSSPTQHSPGFCNLTFIFPGDVLSSNTKGILY